MKGHFLPFPDFPYTLMWKTCHSDGGIGGLFSSNLVNICCSSWGSSNPGRKFVQFFGQPSHRLASFLIAVHWSCGDEDSA